MTHTIVLELETAKYLAALIGLAGMLYVWGQSARAGNS